MKKIVIIALLIPFLYACPIAFETFPDDYSFILDKKEWVEIIPNRKQYKVGETVEIIYKIPNNINDFITKKDKTTNTFILNEHIEHIFVDISFISNPKVKVHINGKEYKRIKVLEYYLDISKNMYICKVKATFLETGEYTFGQEQNSILPHNEIIPKSDNEDIKIFFEPNKENDLAFKVIK